MEIVDARNAVSLYARLQEIAARLEMIQEVMSIQQGHIDTLTARLDSLDEQLRLWKAATTGHGPTV